MQFGVVQHYEKNWKPVKFWNFCSILDPKSCNKILLFLLFYFLTSLFFYPVNILQYSRDIRWRTLFDFFLSVAVKWKLCNRINSSYRKRYFYGSFKFRLRRLIIICNCNRKDIYHAVLQFYFQCQFTDLEETNFLNKNNFQFCFYATAIN